MASHAKMVTDQTGVIIRIERNSDFSHEIKSTFDYSDLDKDFVLSDNKVESEEPEAFCFY